MITLTTRFPRSGDALAREFTNVFVRRLERIAQRRVLWFYSVERTHEAHLHIHGLLYGTSALRLLQIQSAWRLGITDVRVFQTARGGAQYVAKQCYSLQEYDISRRLPPVWMAPERDDGRVAHENEEGRTNLQDFVEV